jgi:hypothetical protein
VSGNGAIEDEMDLLGRGSHPDDELAAFARAVRSTLVERPDAATAMLLVPRLAEAARASVPTRPVAPRVARSRRRPRWGRVAKVAVAVASVPLMFAGLAVAGVNLPRPADSVFEAVGIELPNQVAEDEPSAGSTSDDPGSGEPGARAPENATEKRGHGNAKNSKARSLGKEKTNEARDRDHGRGRGAQGNGRALGKNGQAPGNANGHSKPKGSNGAGSKGGNSPGNSQGQGQANKQPSPGSSGTSNGNGKGHSK